MRWFCWNRLETWGPLLEARPTPKDAHATLLRQYDGLRVFHGCRPVDLVVYDATGVRPVSLAEHQQSAFALAKAKWPRLTDEQFARAVAQTGKPRQPAEVYACVDERELGDGAHFSRYGSEYVLHLLTTLGECLQVDPRPLLDGRGQPAILELGATWKDVDYAGTQLQTWLPDALMTARAGEIPMHVDWCHSQVAAYPASRILATRWLQ